MDPVEPTGMPPWAEEMRKIFRGGVVSQFILHGNVFDLVRTRGPGGKVEFVSLREFLARELFDPFEVVLFYDRGKDGIPHKWLKRVRNSMSTLIPVYNTDRMVIDYIQKAYYPRSKGK